MLFKKKAEIIIVDNFISQSDIEYILDFLKKNKFARARQSENGRNNFEFFTNKEDIYSKVYDSNKINSRNFKLKSKPDILEFYCYQTGDFLTAHSDQPSSFGADVNSNYTAIIYLNEDFIGGETYFCDKNKSIEPKSGRLLLFQHHLRHEGREVELGTKYIFRSNWKIS